MICKKLGSPMAGLALVVVMFTASCSASEQEPTSVPSMSTAMVEPTATLSLTEIAVQMTLLNPTPRGYVSIAYDIESDRVILFGGQTGNIKDPTVYDGETWAFDTTAGKWTQMKPSSAPSGRSAAELVYDVESDRVILFGGADENVWGLSDTWAYDFNTNSWKEMAKGPEHHLGDRLVYDAESDRVVLFGGYGFGFSNGLYNDTWVYDLNSDTWTEMKPDISPPGRNYQAMTYDSRSDLVLMWGGADLSGSYYDSIWSYDFNTNTWKELKPTQGSVPRGRDYPAMVYDANSDRTILFGGSLGGNETWAYDYNTNTWTQLEPGTVPGKLSRHAMVYNPLAHQIILFGGQVGFREFIYTLETWAYDYTTNTWMNITPFQ